MFVSFGAQIPAMTIKFVSSLRQPRRFLGDIGYRLLLLRDLALSGQYHFEVKTDHKLFHVQFGFVFSVVPRPE